MVAVAKVNIASLSGNHADDRFPGWPKGLVLTLAVPSVFNRF